MSRALKILTSPNPILRKKSKEISIKDFGLDKLKKLCLDMGKTMILKDGVGLAAPQVGYNIRLCLINTKEGVKYLINPKISKKSWKRMFGEEGCLSVPNVFGEVKRHVKVSCSFINLIGKKEKIETEGLLARVIQHEIDHLDGVLFIDKARNVKIENNKK